MIRFLLSLVLFVPPSLSASNYDPTAPKNVKRVSGESFISAPVNFEVSMIRYVRKDLQKSQAFLNGQWYGIGEVIGTYKIESITFDTVLVSDGVKAHKLIIAK